MTAEEDWDFVFSERDHTAKLTERGMHQALRHDNAHGHQIAELPRVTPV